jgi:hypothetical protein
MDNRQIQCYHWADLITMQKRTKYHIYILLVVMLFIYGCQHYNLHLNGKWQLLSYIGPDQKELRRDSIFYNFDNYIFSIQNLNPKINPTGEVLAGEFEQQGDSLFLKVVDDWFHVNYFYWTSNEKRFKIMDISSSSLWLKDETGTYHFRSY